MDGVSNVRRWALEVGLAEDDDVEVQKSKKLKTNSVIEPPKYAGSTLRIMLSSAEEQDTPAEEEKDREPEEEMDAYTKSKWKKNM